jgi:hypothetical protein
VIDKHRTGFPIPGDIPFEDLSTGGQMNNHNVIKTNNTPINTNKGGTLGGKGKKRGGLFGLFKNTNVSMKLSIDNSWNILFIIYRK